MSLHNLSNLSNISTIFCCSSISGKGIFKLNIFDESLDTILSSNRVKSMICGFKNNYKCEEFCRHCRFLDN